MEQKRIRLTLEELAQGSRVSRESAILSEWKVKIDRKASCQMAFRGLFNSATSFGEGHARPQDLAYLTLLGLRQAETEVQKQARRQVMSLLMFISEEETTTASRINVRRSLESQCLKKKVHEVFVAHYWDMLEALQAGLTTIDEEFGFIAMLCGDRPKGKLFAKVDWSLVTDEE